MEREKFILLYKRSRKFQPSFLKKSKKSNNQRAEGFIFLYWGGEVRCYFDVRIWVDTSNFTYRRTAAFLNSSECIIAMSYRPHLFFIEGDMYPDIGGP